jgi:hypothetical protein
MRHIKMDIQEWYERIWNELIWLKTGVSGALVNAVMNLQVPYNTVNSLTR